MRIVPLDVRFRPLPHMLALFGPTNSNEKTDLAIQKFKALVYKFSGKPGNRKVSAQCGNDGTGSTKRVKVMMLMTVCRAMSFHPENAQFCV